MALQSSRGMIGCTNIKAIIFKFESIQEDRFCCGFCCGFRRIFGRGGGRGAREEGFCCGFRGGFGRGRDKEGGDW